MPRTAGKYRYRLTIEAYNATTDVWATYGYAWARIVVTATSLDNDERKTKAYREYEVRTPYNQDLSIGTTGYRFKWTVQGANRYLYIYGHSNDEATFEEESVFECSEEVR